MVSFVSLTLCLGRTSSKMKDHVSDFERGRKIVQILLVLAIVFGVTALVFTAENSNQQFVFILAAFVCLLGLVITSLTLCRCPHCGKHILNGVLVVKICPKCKRSLTTGKKVKRQPKNTRS